MKTIGVNVEVMSLKENASQPERVQPERQATRFLAEVGEGIVIVSQAHLFLPGEK